MNVLFVCTGNTCRSAMAEGIFKFLLKKNNIDGINVSSAGISAFQGQSANEKAIGVLAKRGIDINCHRARQLSEEIIKNSHLILTMTNAHKKYISEAMPECSENVYTLKEYAFDEIDGTTNDLDIKDPFGMNFDVYEQTADEIEKHLIKIINKM